VILVDANLLIHAGLTNSSRHEEAREWLDDRINEGTGVGLPWQSLHAFLRLATNRHFARSAPPIEHAWRQVQMWRAAPSVWTPLPGDRYPQILENLLIKSQASGNLVTDAHLAALAIEHGLTLCSADQDFARFSDLRWENPLAP